MFFVSAQKKRAAFAFERGDGVLRFGFQKVRLQWGELFGFPEPTADRKGANPRLEGLCGISARVLSCVRTQRTHKTRFNVNARTNLLWILIRKKNRIKQERAAGGCVNLLRLAGCNEGKGG
jgi:hypothetical protein